MESMEKKLDRLSPEQRKEVEDFADFLLYRSGNSPESPNTATVSLPLQNVAPPPLPPLEPTHVQENPPPGINDAPTVGNSSSVKDGEQPTPVRELVVGGDDRITSEYMDYGQFEQQQSPAVVAVKKVKEKLKQQEKHEKSRELLDWID